jgi:(p)ppGpp synthase/HD superfamily hydrolase
MSDLVTAIDLAKQAHACQVDKGGKPYIDHPMAVMRMVSPGNQKTMTAAVLHDVIEDSDLTLQSLMTLQFHPDVIEAVDALTKRPGETRLQAAHRAKADPIARVVKIADVLHNLDIRRIPEPTKADFDRMDEYIEVLRILYGCD